MGVMGKEHQVGGCGANAGVTNEPKLDNINNNIHTYLTQGLPDQKPQDLGEHEQERGEGVPVHRARLVEHAEDDVRHEEEIDEGGAVGAAI